MYIESAIAKWGDNWTDMSGNPFRGYFSSKENKLCLKLNTPVEEGSTLKRECSGEHFLVRNVANNTKWLELSLLLCKKLARVDRHTGSGLNSFGRVESEILQMIYEKVPMALIGTSRKTENGRDQERVFTLYELATSADFDIRLNDRLTLGNTDPLIVRTVDVIDDLFLRITASKA